MGYGIICESLKKVNVNVISPLNVSIFMVYFYKVFQKRYSRITENLMNAIKLEKK